MDHLHIHDEYPYLNNTTADIRMLGLTPVLSPFSQHTSASRLEMFSKHLSQALVIKGSEFPRLFTGYEHEFGNYTFDRFVLDQDVSVHKIIPKFTSTDIKGATSPSVYVIYIGLDDNRVGYFTVDTYFKGTDGFGYKNVRTNIAQCSVGSFIRKDTLLTHTPSQKGERYCYGTNANVCYMTHPSVAEDGIVISETLAKKFETDSISKIVINVSPNEIPINLYGTDINNVQFMPNIGEFVKNGLLCAFRPVGRDTYAADTDPKSLQEFNVLTDKPYVIEDGSQIIDIEYYTSTKNGIYKPLFTQMEAYRQADINFHKKIYTIYNELKKKGYKFRPEFETLVTKAIHRDKAYLDTKKSHIIHGEKDSPVEYVQIVVYYTYVRHAQPGFKITDRYGAKGVISKILPDDEMPCDRFGRKADMIADPGAIIKRLNPSQAYEPGINYISDMVIMKARQMKSIDAYNYILSWLDEVNSNYANLVRETVKSDVEQFLSECYQDGLSIHIPPFLNTVTGEDNILRWADKFGLEFSPVKFKIRVRDKKTGEIVLKEEESKEDVVIGSKYMMLLYKTTHTTAVSAGKVNHFGIPVKPPSSRKHDTFGSKTPIRYGEDEVRMSCMEVPTQEVVRLMNLHSNSPTGTQIVIDTLISSKYPTRIGRMRITNKKLLSSSSAIAIFQHLMSFAGIDAFNTTCEFTLPEKLMHLAELELPSSSRKKRKPKPKDVTVEDVLGVNRDDDDEETGESDDTDTDSNGVDKDEDVNDSDDDSDDEDNDNNDEEDMNDEDSDNDDSDIGD